MGLKLSDASAEIWVLLVRAFIWFRKIFEKSIILEEWLKNLAKSQAETRKIELLIKCVLTCSMAFRGIALISPRTLFNLTLFFLRTDVFCSSLGWFYFDPHIHIITLARRKNYAFHATEPGILQRRFYMHMWNFWNLWKLPVLKVMLSFRIFNNLFDYLKKELEITIFPNILICIHPPTV